MRVRPVACLNYHQPDDRLVEKTFGEEGPPIKLEAGWTVKRGNTVAATSPLSACYRNVLADGRRGNQPQTEPRERLTQPRNTSSKWNTSKIAVLQTLVRLTLLLFSLYQYIKKGSFMLQLVDPNEDRREEQHDRPTPRQM